MPVQDLIMDIGTVRGPVVLSHCPDYETVNVKKALQVVLDHLGGIRNGGTIIGVNAGRN